ncbi:hypothetical protein H310_01367 [Aphanomyces invadans]|uniref:GST N-terminal domain-containing protein n=1 Tax=Aphanomyces invadans TaxID=157072 RepID=A0A024USH6_9STRA|nr:hypothetical protein H310_01367 [Aphanomyces invadans]ETW08872.1 hypothetical protein H310_01367 [Aphanomyces invadans]|eukprot:XP_008862677.1 hypothetical protein H310_01367 [Aphanomyces invadans]
MPFESTPFESLSEAELDGFKQKDGKVHLFNNIICPFGHRALWTAVEANAPFHVVEVSLADMPAAYIERFNRFGTVPYLLSNGTPIYESAIIAQYLDTKFGNGEIFRHHDPEEAALSQLAAAKFEVGPFYQVLGNASDENVEALKETLTDVETIYRVHAAAYRSSGPFLLGSKLGGAEILIVPFLFRFEILLKHYRNIDLLSGFPLLQAVLAAARTRSAFQDTIRDAQFYIDAYAKYANK